MGREVFTTVTTGMMSVMKQEVQLEIQEQFRMEKALKAINIEVTVDIIKTNKVAAREEVMVVDRNMGIP